MSANARLRRASRSLGGEHGVEEIAKFLKSVR